MKYIGIVILVIFVIFIFIFPFKVTVYNKDEYLFINIGKIINLKLNLFVLFDNNHNENIKKQIKGLKLVKKVKFKELSLDVSGLCFNYQLNGAYFGIIHALMGFLNKVCQMNGIKLQYNLKYLGDKSLKFESVFKARIAYVLAGFYNL